MDKIAVIAGTNVDTQMGCDILIAHNYEPMFLPISQDCDTQSRLQYFSKSKLQELFDLSCEKAISCNAKKIFLYCNSLSCSIDYELTSKKYNIDIITPLETYKNLPTHCKNVALLCANGVSAYKIDSIISENNSSIHTISIGNISIVQMIEKKIKPIDIINNLNLHGLIRYLEKIELDEYKIDTIILGCTHFPYIEEELQKITNLFILNPVSDMIDRLNKI